MPFTEAKLEAAIIDLFSQAGYPHVTGASLKRQPQEVLLKDDLRQVLAERYAADGITDGEIDSVIRQLDNYSAGDLYGSNKTIMKMVSDGLQLKREDRSKADLYIQLIDYTDLAGLRKPKTEELTTIVAEETPLYRTDRNIYKLVNQMEIVGSEKRIPDAILYINGLPLVVFEFKSAVREEATIGDAYTQLTVRYRRDIPELFKYNAFCVISDGANTRAGSFFAGYDYFYSWRRTDGDRQELDGIKALYAMIRGLFNPSRLRDVIRNFIYLPDTSHGEEKILCRYPQYYAATKLFHNVSAHRRPGGDGKGGTYFGATGCGKSYTMLFLTRLLMRSQALASPTIVLITDRTDLDDQLAALFTNAKKFIGDDLVESVTSRKELREKLKDRQSGGVFLTTIHKFNEDTDLLTERTNVVCISDEAHRSQLNLDQKITISEAGVKQSYGFARHLHQSLPNAVYVGFTGTPIDATLDVFGPVVDAYTMTESVADDITVRIVYEGRAAKVLLDNGKLQEIEDYYNQCAEEGANPNAIEASKKANLHMAAILGDKDRLQALAADFVAHYEKRIAEGATVSGKAMFVCANRTIAYAFYKEVIALRPAWAEKQVGAQGPAQKKKSKPIERIKLVMTRNKDDEPDLYHMLGTKEFRKSLDGQFKDAHSNFKIAVVVDMWLTGFDVPFLDTMYIDKPIQKHNLIQTISRVNRKYEGKEKGLVVDYIGIKKQLNQALAQYDQSEAANFEEVQHSIKVVRDHLDLLARIFHKFDTKPYFKGKPVEQLHCLNMAAEFVQLTKELEKRFMYLTRRLKVAYDLCAASDGLTEAERDQVHFYLAVRSILYKLTKGDAPDLTQMNARVQQMITDALQSNGVEEIFKLGEGTEQDLFDPKFMAKIGEIELPHTKFKLLLKLLAKAIEAFKKVNKIKGVDFSKQFKALVDKYNERNEADALKTDVLNDMLEDIMALIGKLTAEQQSFEELGVDFEEKAFYDILKALMLKYKFDYPEDKLIMLAQKVKAIVDDKTQYTDWNRREDIRAELKVHLILLLDDNGYPPVPRDEVYKEVFEQAENFKKYNDEV